MAAWRRGDPHPRLPDLLDAVIVGGAMVGGIAGDLARSVAAHAFYNAVTQLWPRLGATHGELVGYGLIVQELLLGRPASEVRRLQGLLRELGLPADWAGALQGRVAPTEAEMVAVGRAMLASPNMTPMPALTEADILQAFRRAEALAAGAAG